MATVAAQMSEVAGLTIDGERYEIVKARIDLAEAETEYASCTTAADRALARQRVEEARCRLVRWRRPER